jgi:SWIM zinc finger
MSAHVKARADRLEAAARTQGVQPVPGLAVPVDRYLVFIPDNPAAAGLPIAKCDCKAGRNGQACSHALTALRLAAR